MYSCLYAQLCLTLCDPMDCSPQGSSVHEILQARILEWVAIFSSRGSFLPRDRTCVSCISSVFTGRFSATVPPWKPMFGSVRMQKWIQDRVPHSSSPHGLTQPPRTHQGFRFWPLPVTSQTALCMSRLLYWYGVVSALGDEGSIG